MIPERQAGWGRGFPSTHWTVVLAAGQGEGSARLSALSEVCGAYWQPLYAFARKLGHAPADAEDLTQSFFATLLERPLLERADAAKGRFRSFLLGAFKNHLGKERERVGALKRAGAHPHLSLDVPKVEARFATELATNQSPETLFERAWALAMIEEAMQRLEAGCRRSGRLELFREIQPCLEGDPDARRYAVIAGRLGTTEGTIQVTVKRMRQRYLEHLRSVILQTVGGPEEVEDELRYLFGVLKG